MATLAFACGGKSGSDSDGGNGSGDGDAGGGSGEADAFEMPFDAPPFGGSCTPTSGAPQCSDCMDNDADGFVDGFDPQCAGPLDRLEDSFATGIPGDNMDSTYQDCFFDGDSGGGNDGCSQHVCCLLQAADKAACAALAPDSNSNKYVKSECYKPWGTVDVPAKCTMQCGPLAPPGCDCFGCCTVCNENGCADIILNPAVSPDCDQASITDPTKCKVCVKTQNCGAEECAYDGVSCTPCPGQCTDANDPSTCNPPLPSSCGGQTACPSGYTECQADGTCPAGTYCSSGCCVGMIL